MRAATGEKYVPVLYPPKGVDFSSYFEQFDLTYLDTPLYRREATKYDPLLFGLLYFERQLVSAETGPDIHLSQLNLDIAKIAERWAFPLGPAECRVIVVAPRGGAKSTWARIDYLWAMAHGHRRYLLILADNGKLAQRYMRNVRRQLSNNVLLREDFPGLCNPAMNGGRPLRNTANEYVARSGAVIAAAGIDSNELGANEDGMRPDLIVSDDIEKPEGSGYSPHQKRQRLSILVNGVLPMNTNAAVLLCGTVTAHNSIIHDAARAAHGEQVDWIEEQGFRVHYQPPIVNGDSFWPARYPKRYLDSISKTPYYRMNFLNLPKSLMFEARHMNDRVNPNALSDRLIVWVDPGVTSSARSDPTGIAVVGRYGLDAVVEYADSFRFTPTQRKEFLGELVRENPLVEEVIVEDNNGGDEIPDAVRSVVPKWVKVRKEHTKLRKEVRFEKHLEYHELGWVWYARRFPKLLREMLDAPRGTHDDVLDAVAGGTNEVLKGRPFPRPERAL